MTSEEREDRLDQPLEEGAKQRAVVAAASPLATAEGEVTEAGQEQPPPDAPSALPTQRPEPARPFADLLAEARGGPANKRSSAPAPPPARPSAPAPAPSARTSAPAPAAAATVPMVPQAPSTQAARTLGAYRVLGEIGSGGMAVVYKALQPALDRIVAIKELRPEFVSDKQITARFEREATSLATLQHGNIVHIYDFIRDVDSAYIVMEYVDGIDLFDLLHQVERLPPDVAAVIGLQLAEGLEYAHYHRIIHRDVKPSNLLISRFGEVKIMDFGIARDPGRADLTQVGMSLGTPAYMAPEQIRGDKIDFRADIFSFGIVLYEMLTGTKPWGDDEGTSVARKVLYNEPTPPQQHVPDLPPALIRIIARCLEKDPERRYVSTHDLRRELEAYLAQEVRIDPRQRLVIFLRNRALITEGDATSFVHAPSLYDGVLRRRDRGLPQVAPRALLRPVAITAAAGAAVVALALLLGLARPFASFGRLPEARPQLEIATPAADDPAPKKRRSLAPRR